MRLISRYLHYWPMNRSDTVLVQSVFSMFRIQCICVPVLKISVLIARAKMSLTNRQGCSKFKGGLWLPLAVRVL